LFPQVLEIVKRWMSEAVSYEKDTYPGLLLLQRLREEAVEKICKAIITDESQRRERILPIFDTTQPEGSTDGVDFDTTRVALLASPERSHVTHVVLDGPSGNTWEERTMAILEDLTEVAAYVKNDHLGFTIPYTHQGQSAHYIPDFIARLERNGDEITRTLVIEVSGGQKSHHSPGTVAEKAATARDLWVPAVNRNGSFGLWSYVEIKDPHAAREQLREIADELLAVTKGVTSAA
jgi:type III restriction enzyme